MAPQTFLLYGRSGSGKGTQAQMLIEYLAKKNSENKVVYIETGALFRKFMENETYTSKRVAGVLSNGGLLPEFLPIWIWTDHLINNFTGSEHLIMDGVCRRIAEAPVLDAALKFYGRTDVNLILVNTSRQWSKERLLGRGRADDNDHDIDRRLEWYDVNVVPAIQYFSERKGYNVLDINGEQTIEDVHKELVSKLEMRHAI